LTGLAGHIAQHLGELHVHLEQGLLHVEDVRGAVFEQLGAVTQQGAQGDQVGFGTERTLQQAVTVQGLNPLTVQHVRLASGDAPQRAGADQAAAKARRFERLEERNPVDTGAFHGHCLDVMFFEPGGDGLQVGGVIAEGAHQLGALVARHADHDLVSSEVHSGGVRVDLAH